LVFGLFLGLFFAFFPSCSALFYPIFDPPTDPPTDTPTYFLEKTKPLTQGAQKTFKCITNIGIYYAGKLTFKPYFYRIYTLKFYPFLTQIVQFVLS
jgi:hypothetical protein